MTLLKRHYMFKRENFENELAQTMAKNLETGSLAKRGGLNSIEKAIDFLQSAAEIFDHVGFYNEAEEITQMLEKIASNKKKV